MFNDPLTQFLRAVGRRLRRDRTRFDPPATSVRSYGPGYAEIWFPTVGCRWDFQGYCTMCNYGHAVRITPDRMVAAVRLGLQELGTVPATLWVSAFNVLEEREVPPEARRAIYRLLAQTDATTILSESHPETIRPELVRECVEMLPGKTFGLQLGVESMNDFVRNRCVNKGIDRTCIRDAIAAIHEAGAICYLNLLIGSPFLSTAEAVRDALASVEDGLGLGADRVVLFPNHVKQHTLVQWLFDRGLYRPPSLWALVQVLAELGPEARARTSFAWFEPVDHPGKAQAVAPKATPEVLRHLREHLLTEAPEPLDRLIAMRTPCRDTWLSEYMRPDELSLLDRMRAILPSLAGEVLGPDWWGENGAMVLETLEKAWASEASSPAAR